MTTTKILLTALFFVGSIAFANIEVHEFDNPAQEAQYKALIADFRCPTCQNQNLAGSDAPIAKDLKNKTYQMVKEGRSDSEIRDYMFERYGDFISYKPPVRPSTWILWFFPPILLIIILISWVVKNRNKNKLSKKVASPDIKPLSAEEQAQLDNLLSQYQSQKEPKQ